MRKFLLILFLSLFLLSTGTVSFAAKKSGPGGICCEKDDCFEGECRCLPTPPDPDCALEKDSDQNILGLSEGIAGICSKDEVICSFSSHTTIEGFIKTVTDWIFYLALIICPLLIVIGAFFFLTSGGEPKRTATGKALIKWAIIGLAVIVLSKALFSAMRNIITGG